jgi:hypothetical protein
MKKLLFIEFIGDIILIPLTDAEVEEIIELTYNTCEKYILKHVNKKEFENIAITINLNRGVDCFDIDIDIDLDSDSQLPDDLADKAIELGLEAVDEYIENRNNNLD